MENHKVSGKILAVLCCISSFFLLLEFLNQLATISLLTGQLRTNMISNAIASGATFAVNLVLIVFCFSAGSAMNEIDLKIGGTYSNTKALQTITSKKTAANNNEIEVSISKIKANTKYFEFINGLSKHSEIMKNLYCNLLNDSFEYLTIDEIKSFKSMILDDDKYYSIISEKVEKYIGDRKFDKAEEIAKILPSNYNKRLDASSTETKDDLMIKALEAKSFVSIIQIIDEVDSTKYQEDIYKFASEIEDYNQKFELLVRILDYKDSYLLCKKIAFENENHLQVGWLLNNCNDDFKEEVYQFCNNSPVSFFSSSIAKYIKGYKDIDVFLQSTTDDNLLNEMRSCVDSMNFGKILDYKEKYEYTIFKNTLLKFANEYIDAGKKAIGLKILGLLGNDEEIRKRISDINSM